MMRVLSKLSCGSAGALLITACIILCLLDLESIREPQYAPL